MTTIASLQKAAKMIETDGVGAFHAIKSSVGTETALALIIGHLRSKFAATKHFPTDTALNDHIFALLAEDLPSGVMQVFGAPHVLFYMNMHYALDNFSAFSVF
jgi:hypothetical protein